MDRVLELWTRSEGNFCAAASRGLDSLQHLASNPHKAPNDLRTQAQHAISGGKLYTTLKTLIRTF